MKKFLALTLALALTLSLCGCFYSAEFSTKHVTSEKNSSIVPSVNELPSTDETSSEENSSNLESSQPEAIETVLVCPLEDSMYPAASITLKSDFTFDMQVNLLSAFGNLNGSYEIGENKVITCTVSEIDFQGFTGDDVQAFELQPNGEDSYTIQFLDVEFIGAIHSGAVLSKE